jgi:two-component system, NarL family, sensor histidine kinase UhpB
MRRCNPALRTRIALVLTGLAAVFLLALGGGWLQGKRTGIAEEMEAASRVSGQWLMALLREQPAEADAERLTALLAPLGRVRAEELTLQAGEGRVLYRSPPSHYKQGRAAPAWFARLVTPPLTAQSFAVGGLQVVLTPDPSRAILDAWDDLCAMAGWAALFLALLFVVVARALDRALRPLEQVLRALEATGWGRLDMRLPVFATPDLGRLASAFNGMAARLAEAVDDNVRLHADREVAQRLQARVTTERRTIARELHDELAQSITAVRALAGAIVLRSELLPAIQRTAEGIIAASGEMQAGVRALLTRLAPLAGADELRGEDACAAIAASLDTWQARYPDIRLVADCRLAGAALPGVLGFALLRIVQEALTNVVRHAAAATVTVRLERRADAVCLEVADNGCGPQATSAQPGCGRGLHGMRERVAELDGEFSFSAGSDGGSVLLAVLPLAACYLER